MMIGKGVVVDTNVFCYMMKNLPIGAEYRRLLIGHNVHVSFVTRAELLCWADRGDWGMRRRLELQSLLAECAVLPYSDGMDKIFARVMAERSRAGRRMEHADAWIAATALFYGLPLVTHDGDFVHTRGLRIITASPIARAARNRMPVLTRPVPTLDMRCRCSL
jgi:tRNA(fMet)-specific endonuclease VapC